MGLEDRREVTTGAGGEAKGASGGPEGGLERAGEKAKEGGLGHAVGGT